MSFNYDDLRGAGLGELLPSSEGRRAMTKDRSLAGADEVERAPIQYVEKSSAETGFGAPVDYNAAAARGRTSTSGSTSDGVYDHLRGAGLGELLPSSEGRRAMTKDRSLAGADEVERAPIQYVEKSPAKTAVKAPVDDDPFGIFGLTPAAAPAPARVAAPPAPANVFGFSNPAPVTKPVASQPFGQDDPFAAFAPSHAAAPAPATQEFDPFAGFAPTQPAAAPASVVAVDNGWGIDDDFFSPPPASKADATSVPDLAALQIKDKPPPLPTEGSILARLSSRSLFVKDWSDVYWVFRGYHLLIYRNRDDFKYSPQGENIKKDIVITAKMRCLPIKKKEYSGFGQLHNFFLEEVEDYGANQIAKFASRELKDLEIVYNQINRRLHKLKGV